ncbi:hypothetical protein [Dyadobacter pollutisoli]|uniref:Uncharacterized protein n=1 Tax=Dyadobacter pollutisoli TaxID=2910158 RepID=A0A9E8SJK7_9BACT|nr:hypothetical protein [Dyadobacter pollutisoli]WAC10953.1 hypothetical protein ON006_24800 [Dyadobacter pollutisoli]
MKTFIYIASILLCGPLAAQQTAPAKADAQFFMGILLDKIITIGTLKACPAKDNPLQYYYLPNKLRIATDETTGQPKFSFIKYVTNKRSDAESAEIKEGEGGGWVHVLMGLSVSDEDISAAASELAGKVPGAKLVGPVIYRSGTVSLITKSAATNDKIRILGTEKAPVLDGDFIAVGFPLNATDATILWETMKGPNPDVSLNFNMTIAGLNSPIGAKMEVNWDIVNQHRIMNLALDMPVVKAEISDMVTDLRQNGTIKVTTVGNKPLDAALITKIENMVVDLCFSKSLDSSRLGRSSSNYLISPGKDGQSRRDRELARESIEDGKERTRLGEDLTTAKTEQTAAKAADKTASEKADATQTANIKLQKEKLNKEVETATKALATAKEKHAAAVTKQAAAKDSTEKAAAKKELAEANAGLEKAQKTKDNAEKASSNFEDKTQAESLTKTKKDADATGKEVDKAAKKIAGLEEDKKDLNGISLADFSVEAVYHRAKVKRSGQFVLDLNHYDPVTIDEPFGGNIGRINCRGCLLEVNTASSLYTQRELVTYLDGGALADFDKYINYVTVKMRKKHQAGELTYDEVRIDRKNFNTKGNAFKMMYGWGNGDNDRRNWLDYDYQTTWNFFGGYTIYQDWKPSNENVIGVSPPFNRSEIRLMADKEMLKAASVRAVFVKIYYKLGDTEYVKRATISPASDILQQQVEIIHPKEDLTYSFETEWVLNDNTNIKSGKTTSTSDLLFVDVLPKTN